MTTFSGGTIDGNILPTQTGKDLGSSAQRWDAFLQDLDAASFKNILVVGATYSTIQAAHDALPAGGGTIFVPSGSTPFGAANTTTLSITKPTRLIFENAAFTYAGTGQAIEVASGLSGVIIEGSGAPELNDATQGTSISITNTAADGIDALNCPSIVIRNISLVGPGSGTGKGIIVTGNGFILDNTQTSSFGGDGTEIDGTRGNSNSGVVFRARSYSNGGRGFDVFGADSNAIVWIASDAQANTGTQYVFTNSSVQTFSGLHAQPSTDVNSVSFVSSVGNWGSVYVEPISPFAAAAISFDANSKYNNLFLLNGRVVSDSGTGNQWFFAASDAGAGVAGVGQFQWNSANTEDTINTILQIRRAGQATELTKLGMYFKTGDFHSGLALSTAAALNFIYNTNGTSYKANFFNNAADAALDTATPVMFLDTTINGAIGGTTPATGAFTTLTTSGLLTNYNSIATVAGGVPAEYATVDLTAQGAAISATTLYAVPASGAGMYRVSWVATVTQAATTSCVLGGTTGFQLQYTDANDSVVKLSNPTTVTSSAINATGTSISGVFVAYCKASTNLQYLFGYTSVGATPMQYNLHVICEKL